MWPLYWKFAEMILKKAIYSKKNEQVKELNQGLPGTNPATGQRDLNSGLSVYKCSALNTAPHCFVTVETCCLV